MIRCPEVFRLSRSRARNAATSALVLAILMLGAMPMPAVGADAAAGKTLALQWCSSCHLVSQDQATAASVSLPSFYDIAKDPDWTETTLATFLADPHPKMPDMSLGNREIANLAKYINSLGPQ